MGATNCPETPRQKMIGMMYLVYLALLALNVSKDILDAFVTVNDAMEQTTANFTTKVDQSYAMFDAQEQNSPDKVKPYNDKAKQVRKVSTEMIKYLTATRDEMYSKVEGCTPQQAAQKTLKDMKSKDDYEKPTNYFCINEKKAYEMQEKIREYKKQLIKIVDDTNYVLPNGLEVDKTFKDNDGKDEDWAFHNFNHIVAAASYTLINKLIGEVRNTEFETVNFLNSAIDAGSFKFDMVSAKVIPNSKIVFSGDSYEADIIVAAFDSRENPTVYWSPGRDTATEDDISKLTTIEGEEGVVHLKIPTGGIGDQKFAGLIKIMSPDGTEKYYPFHDSYTVTKPTAAVAADKMNVFYANIGNPVSIAAPVAPEKLRINWGGASATSQGGGKYSVTVPTSLVGKEITVSVSADVGGGKSQNMGSTTFRVKAVPEPSLFIGGNISGGKQPKDAILANPMITAKMSPDFNFELRWSVISYKVTFVKGGVEDAPIMVQGGRFTDQVISKIRSASSGTIVEFTDIKIKSEAGNRAIQRPLSVRIK